MECRFFSVVLVIAVHKLIVLYIYLLFFKLFSHAGCHRVLKRVPCLCWVSILSIVVCMYQSETPNMSLPPTCLLLLIQNLFSMSVSPFWFCKYVQQSHFFDFSYKQYHMIFDFLCLTSLNIIVSIYVAANDIISFFLIANIPLYIKHLSMHI